MYTQLITQTPIFKIIHEQFQSNPNTNVIIYSYGALKSFSHFDNRQEVEEFFNSDEHDFSDCYCLMELLINYPNPNNYVWSTVENAN